MSATETQSKRGVRRCHCGAILTVRQDHCPCCGCEEQEHTCDHVCAKPATRIPVNHADHW